MEICIQFRHFMLYRLRNVSLLLLWNNVGYDLQFNKLPKSVVHFTLLCSPRPNDQSIDKMTKLSSLAYVGSDKCTTYFSCHQSPRLIRLLFFRIANRQIELKQSIYQWICTFNCNWHTKIDLSNWNIQIAYSKAEY